MKSFNIRVISNGSATPIVTTAVGASSTPTLTTTNKQAKTQTKTTAAKGCTSERIQTRSTTKASKKGNNVKFAMAPLKNNMRRSLFSSNEDILHNKSASSSPRVADCVGTTQTTGGRTI